MNFLIHQICKELKVKYSTTLLSASVAIALGISGAAFAVENGDFELPADAPNQTVPTDWTTSDDNAVGINDAIPRPASGGEQYLDLGWAPTIGSDASASSDADEDLTGCSPYDLAVWDASGWYQTFDGDTAYFDVTFDAGPGSLTSPLTGGDETADGWVEVTDTGNIDADATMATVTVGGVEIDEIDGAADVIWDDVSFTADCVDNFSKISGKIGTRRGTHSFGGAFGELESGTPVGTIDVNYKDLRVSCTFTNLGFSFSSDTGPFGDGFIVWDTSYLCSNTDAGTAIVGIHGGSGGPEGTGKNKDRGAVAIRQATDSAYNISIITELDKGNTDIGIDIIP
jgi:hypothetical protein